MSWSFQGVGKPSKFPAAIDKAVEGYGPAEPGNQSRREFESAAAAMKILILMNSDDNAVSVSANGYASFDAAGKMTYGLCHVEINSLYGLVD